MVLQGPVHAVVVVDISAAWCSSISHTGDAHTGKGRIVLLLHMHVRVWNVHTYGMYMYMYMCNAAGHVLLYWTGESPPCPGGACEAGLVNCRPATACGARPCLPATRHNIASGRWRH
eukprot:362891-Chlamydomonas_euryale.AAC.1